MEGPLLEWVFYKSVGSDREDKWMEWYDFHHYSIAQLPGWTWARMYKALIGSEKYLSLYRIENYDALKQVYGWPDPEAGRKEVIEKQLHPVLRRDWAEKQRRGFGDTTPFMFNGGARKDSGHWGWRQIAGAPFDNPLASENRPIGFELVGITADKAEGWRNWFLDERFPALLRLPGVAMGGVFEITTEGWDEEPRFRFATIFELQDEDAAFAIGGSTNRNSKAIEFWENPDARSWYSQTTQALVNYYAPISKHWSFKKVEWESERE